MNIRDIELIFELTASDFKLKYRNTLFGYLWSVINPISLLITLYVIFSYVMKINIPNFQLFLLIGIIVWNYFSEATLNSLNSLVKHASILKKHRVNSIAVVISSCLSSLIGLTISFIILIFLTVYFKVQITALAFFGILFVLLLFILTLGISLILTTIYTYFKDITHIWNFSLLLGFWISPIIYSEMIIPADIRKFYMLNPLARLISHTRNAFLYNYLEAPDQLIFTCLLCLIILIFGLFVFGRVSRYLGEKI